MNLIDERGQSIDLSEQDNIFVFSEKYTDENVRIDDDGLGTIILLGSQVDLQAEIDKYIALKEVAETAFEQAQSDFEQFKQGKNPISPEYHFSRIKLAHLQIEAFYKDYLKQAQAKHKSETALREKGNKLNSISQHLKTLEQKKSDASLAIGAINNALDYVFFSKGRLSIELINDKYYLKSNGQNVKPKDISVGERNIISLCYFFVQILANQNISRLYKNEELIVIDDPISSFEIENKVGIISLLRYQANRIINGNQNSKI